MGSSLARVTDTTDLNPRLRRITFTVDDLPGLGLPGLADDAVGIYFPAATTESTAPEGRNYSVRAVDHASSTMTVDFVVHSHGVATQWAQRARPGDEVTLDHARGWYRPEPTTDWQLLVADLAGLPALARILDELPTGTAAIVVVEVLDVEDLEYLAPHVRADPDSSTAPGAVEIIPIIARGNGFRESRLTETVGALTHPDGRGYCWYAAEATPSRAIRKHLRTKYGWDRGQYDIIGYWRRDGEEWSRRFERHGEELYAIYQQAIAAGKGEKVAAEEFDDALERMGL